MVVGVGTALTVDWLDADGRHRGGRIAPSPTLMRDALHARAAQLPASGGRYVEFGDDTDRSEEHTSELQSLMRISYAVFCLKKKKIHNNPHHTNTRYNTTNKEPQETMI